MRRLSSLLVVLVVFLSAQAPNLAGTTGRSVAREALRRVLARDARRDSATASARLTGSRTVWRYTGDAQMRREVRGGIPAGSHMTSRVTAGRVPSASLAMRRYGLPAPPAVRETIRLPAASIVMFNKVLGGSRGLGEIKSATRLPASAIRKFSKLSATVSRNGVSRR